MLAHGFRRLMKLPLATLREMVQLSHLPFVKLTYFIKNNKTKNGKRIKRLWWDESFESRKGHARLPQLSASIALARVICGVLYRGS